MGAEAWDGGNKRFMAWRPSRLGNLGGQAAAPDPKVEACGHFLCRFLCVKDLGLF